MKGDIGSCMKNISALRENINLVIFTKFQNLSKKDVLIYFRYILLLNGIVLGWPKISFEFFHMILKKRANVLVNQTWPICHIKYLKTYKCVSVLWISFFNAVKKLNDVLLMIDVLLSSLLIVLVYKGKRRTKLSALRNNLPCLHGFLSLPPSRLHLDIDCLDFWWKLWVRSSFGLKPQLWLYGPLSATFCLCF